MVTIKTYIKMEIIIRSDNEKSNHFVNGLQARFYHQLVTTAIKVISKGQVYFVNKFFWQYVA